MMEQIHSVSRERLTTFIDGSPRHLRPLLVAARDAGVRLCMVAQGRHRFDLPTRYPTVLLVGDDMHVSMGPDGFHRQSLRRFIRACRCAVIVSSAPLIEPYAAAAASAALGMNVILVETRLSHEQVWRSFIESERPDVSLFISTVKPEGGIH